MDVVASNAVFLPLFLTWFIPVSIRDWETGRFKGFSNPEFLATAFALVVFESFLMISNFGLHLFTLLRISGFILLTFVASYLFIKATNKQLFGKPFEFKNDQQ